MKSTFYSGNSNPSAASALNNHVFVVADDEVNQLSIYDRDSTQPKQIIALSEVFQDVVSDGKAQEIDIEGAAIIDNILFWIGSYSTNRQGEQRPARQRLLAMSLTADKQQHFHAEALGHIGSQLLDSLITDPRFHSYQLAEARQLPPKSIGGLSIEGLAATPAKTLLIGFRNPLIGGKIKQNRLQGGRALVIELLNPLAVIAGQKAHFADPIELNLKGLGIRDICWQKHHKYIIVAGPYHGNYDDEHKGEKTRLFRWSHKSTKVKAYKKIDLKDLNIEAAIFYPNDNKCVQLLSDDGQQTDIAGFRSVIARL